MFNEPDGIQIQQKHSIGDKSIANSIKRDTTSNLKALKKADDDFLAKELRRIRDEGLKNNLVKHTQLLQKAYEPDDEDLEYRYNFHQRHTNHKVVG